MNWVDLVIIVILGFFTLEGYGRSFILELVDLFSFFLALVLSLRFYNYGAEFLQKIFQIAHSLSNVLGFFLAWSLVEVALALISHQFLRFFPQKIDRLFKHLGFIPSFLRGLIFVSLILVLIGTFPIQPQIKAAVESSKLGNLIVSKAYQLENPLKAVFGGITNDSLTFLTIEPKTNESVNLGFKTSNFKPRPDLEDQMIALVNKERLSRGFKALSYDPALLIVAREHSADMFERGYFSHYSPEGKTVADRALSHGVDYSVIGENLAYAPSLELAHNGLMNSPGHRANILSLDFNKIAIGIEDAGSYGLMITQVFKN